MSEVDPAKLALNKTEKTTAGARSRPPHMSPVDNSGNPLDPRAADSTAPSPARTPATAGISEAGIEAAAHPLSKAKLDLHAKLYALKTTDPSFFELITGAPLNDVLDTFSEDGWRKTLEHRDVKNEDVQSAIMEYRCMASAIGETWLDKANAFYDAMEDLARSKGGDALLDLVRETDDEDELELLGAQLTELRKLNTFYEGAILAGEKIPLYEELHFLADRLDEVDSYMPTIIRRIVRKDPSLRKILCETPMTDIPNDEPNKLDRIRSVVGLFDKTKLGLSVLEYLLQLRLEKLFPEGAEMRPETYSNGFQNVLSEIRERVLGEKTIFQ